jgi:hypothetical protein
VLAAVEAVSLQLLQLGGALLAQGAEVGERVRLF